MNKAFYFLFFLLLLSIPAMADHPRVEVFGGYSYLNLDTGNDRLGIEKGFGVDVSGDLTDTFAIVGSFSGNYEEGSHLYYYLFGPRFTRRGESFTAFGQALIGGSTAGDDGGSESGLAFGFGGGVDINAGESLAVRVFQFDYAPNRFFDVWFHTVRIQAGVVFKVK